MRITNRRLTLVACAVAALVSATAGTSSTAACDPGLVKAGGKFWVQYCGPATATAKVAGKTPVRFTSGTCIKRNGVMILYLGRRIFKGVDSKTKYWEFVGALRGDGVFRRDLSVEWWLGKRHYALDNVKVTFKNRQTKGTYTGKLVGGKGTASGSFRCSGSST